MASYNTRYEKPPSAAVLAARLRRIEGSKQNAVQVEWFITEICDKVATNLKKRVMIATELVRSKTVQNISRPVTKTYWTRQVRYTNDQGKVRTRTEHGVSISDRSKKGEFPKADTVQLLRTLFTDLIEHPKGCFTGYVGTPLDYGIILELKLDRSFLVRTLNEERSKVWRILTGPLENDSGSHMEQINLPG